MRALALSSCVRAHKASRLLVVVLLAAGTGAIAPRPARGGYEDREIEQLDSEEARRHSTERRIHSVARELAATAKRYGADSVSLQVALLLHTLRAGAVGASEVSVVGVSPHAGPAFLEVDVTTGIIFDADASTPSTCIRHLWQQIAVPTLQGMHSFEVQPRGLELVFVYGVQRFADSVENKADPSLPAEARTVRVAIPESVLAELAVGAIPLDTVLGRATVHDGSRIVPTGELVASQ
jgi:hypothetical protein